LYFFTEKALSNSSIYRGDAMNPQEFERKLSAILSADVVEYSRLMSEDEDLTIRTLTGHRKMMTTLIEHHRGRVVDSPGDNLLSTFPSVTQAVDCAVEIQREMAERNAEFPEDRRMEYRIGVNLGDVVEEGERIYGDGVNIAARLESLAAPGGICISGFVYHQVKNRLKLEYDYLGEQSVKNIKEPVPVYRVLSFPGAAAHRVIKTKKAAEKAQMASPFSDKPSIAVLPFVNMSGDPEQEYFSDGITEDLITDISKISGLFVIARNSTFTYKGQSVDVRQIANDLGVRYVLEGSVRKAAGKVRINAQLVDSTTGRHLWAERYDGSLEDIFALQDEITAKIVSGLEVNLTATERKRAGHKITTNVDAYDLFLRGRAEFYHFNETDNAKAKRNFERAIELDPNFAAAYAYLSLALMCDWNFLWPGHEDGLDRALGFAQKAVALDDALGMAHARLGWIHLFRGEHDKAIASFERAVALDPNDAETYAYFAEALNYSGDPEKSIALTEKAMRFDPLIPPNCAFHRGHSYYLLGRYDDAEAVIRSAIDRAPTFAVAHLYLAVVYSEIDRVQEAAAEIEAVLKLVPGYTLAVVNQMYPYRSAEVRNRFLESLRKAGLPD
jgi:adenylate cyclase